MLLTGVIRRIPVAFEGEGSGVEELAWGQLDMWLTMSRQRSWLPMGGSKALPPGTTVEDVADELRYLMSRYQPMRTRLLMGADGAGGTAGGTERRPRQRVFGSGEILLEVIDAGTADPRSVADATAHRYHHSDYDFAADWPVRMGVVVRNGQADHLVAIMCHLVADGFGAGVMLEEVAARPAGPADGTQSLDQARWQRSPAGRRQNDSALRYWEGLLRAIPARTSGTSALSASPQESEIAASPSLSTLPSLSTVSSLSTPSTGRREPRHRVGVQDSPALHLAAQAVAARRNVDTSLVLLTAYAVALTSVTGVSPAVIRPMASNRFRRGLARSVCTIAQPGLCVLDVADIPFDEALRRTGGAAMAAYKYAYYDPADMADLVARIAQERGHPIMSEHFFNDRRTSGREAPVFAPEPDRVREALSQTTLRWTAARDDPFEPLMVHVEDSPGTSRLTVFVDTCYLPPEGAEALLRAMEDVVVAEAVGADVAV